MNRIKTVNIAGKEYQLNFSVNAAAAVHDRYGGFGGINPALGLVKTEGEEPQKSMVEITDEIAWMLETMIREGAAYSHVVDGKEAPIISAQDIKTVLSVIEILEMRLDVLEAVGAGLTATVETEPSKKNGNATQGD